MSATDIILERETANDQFALIVTILAPPGKAVEKDELIFEIENSKAVQELRAPEAGILTHYLEVGQAVDFGIPIAQIVSEEAWAQIVAHLDAPEPAAAAGSPSEEAKPIAGIEIVLERETANDESAVLVGVPVASGTAVTKDELIFEIENSKATQELYAPEAGVLVHQLAVGQTVNFGVPIARIVSAEDWERMGRQPIVAQATPSVRPPEKIVQLPSQLHSTNGNAVGPAPVEAPSAHHRVSNPRFSRAATALMTEHGLTTGLFTTGFVTSQDVRAYLQPAQAVSAQHKPELRHAPSPPTPQKTAAASESAAARPVAAKQGGQPVGRGKRTEIEVLSSGAGDTMLSVLGVTLGPLRITREPGDFLDGRITDLVIYEASRLMKKYPRLNSYYADGQIFAPEAVHAGMAIDSGGRLVVYGIENADRLGLHDLADTMANAVERYVNNELTGGEMSRATFTVTDLSADELDFVLPLLPRGQCCILGITHSRQSGFRLFAGFDHRVTEGREIGSFLGELRERLLTFASVEQGGVTEAGLSRCVYCERTVAEAVTRSNEKGLLKTVDRNGQEVLCCGSCWNGW